MEQSSETIVRVALRQLLARVSASVCSSDHCVKPLILHELSERDKLFHLTRLILGLNVKQGLFL